MADRIRQGAQREHRGSSGDHRGGVFQIDTNTARVYADVRRELKIASRPIPENDIWIAALARQHGLDIVSKDDHFEHVNGVTRFSW
jgi:tRNA(fMet)-specific endonuclease VapC